MATAFAIATLYKLRNRRQIQGSKVNSLPADQKRKCDMPVVIYGLKNCDTCRKALKALPQATLSDVRADGIPEDVLQAAWDQFGVALLNMRSTTWRGLDEAARQGDPLELIKAHPAVMKRPLIAVDKTLFLSWSSQVESDVKAML